MSVSPATSSSHKLGSMERGRARERERESETDREKMESFSLRGENPWTASYRCLSEAALSNPGASVDGLWSLSHCSLSIVYPETKGLVLQASVNTTSQCKTRKWDLGGPGIPGFGCNESFSQGKDKHLRLV